MLKREDFRIRDPFILLEGDTYYMYGSTTLMDGSYETLRKFCVYTSKDLEYFEGPFVVFDGELENFWATCDYWASEVWKYKERFYLFGSFKSENSCRGTQILVSESPLGPFKPLSERPITPKDWDCLDGTLWVEEDAPYMVFCHEWAQCGDGEICAVQLSENLSEPVGAPFLLFRASANPFITTLEGPASKNSRVTDGPFLFKENGKLKMIWSSYTEGGKYAILEAVADSLKGVWTHHKPRFDFDGGHAMIFTALNGKKYLSMHAPNTPNLERAVFIPYEEQKNQESK